MIIIGVNWPHLAVNAKKYAIIIIIMIMRHSVNEDMAVLCV